MKKITISQINKNAEKLSKLKVKANYFVMRPDAYDVLVIWNKLTRTLKYLKDNNFAAQKVFNMLLKHKLCTQ